MECVTCKSPRIERFVDTFGDKRVFCRSCWVSFPESGINDPMVSVHTNFGAVRSMDSY
jgi:formate-dependent nitrite reductase cytochrome c552 subunit